MTPNSPTTSTPASASALLSFPARLHAPLFEALQKRSSEEKSGSDANKIENNEDLVCFLDDGAAGATTTRVLARRDLSRERDLFLFEPLACGTRSGIARATVEDGRARSVMSEVVAEALFSARRREKKKEKTGGGGELPPPLLPPFSGSETSDPLLNTLWGWLLPAGVGIDAGGSGRPDARWALPPKEIAWAQHSEEGRGPNARVSLLTLDDDSDDDDDEDEKEGEKQGKEEEKEEKLLLVLWLERDVPRGEALTLDWSFEEPDSNFRGSLRRAASLVTRLREGRWSEPGVREQLAAAVAEAASAGPPAGDGGGAAERRERQRQARQRQQIPSSRTLSSLPPPTRHVDDERDFLIWSDYPVFSEWLDALEGEEEEGEGSKSSSSSLGLFPRSRRRLRRTSDRASADLVLSRLPLRSFGSEGGGEDQQQQQLCNQFPFEGALVRKDMLPSTARGALSSRRCYGGSEGDEKIGGETVFWPPSSDGLHPPWLPPTFDLSTELHYLLQAIEREEEKERKKSTSWILKPAQASRSLGLAISSSKATLAAFAMRSAAGGDRVAQRYVERPVLTRNGKKFDLRLYVVVRSFGGEGRGGGGKGEEEGEASPPRASLYSKFHAREAPRRYCPPGGEHSGKGLISQSVFGTVACYNKGGGEEGGEEEGGEKSPFLPRDLVDETLLLRGYDPKAVAVAVSSLVKKVVEAGSGVVKGPWPGSRAVYGLDVVLDESEKTRVEMEKAEGGKVEADAAASQAEGEERTKNSPSASTSSSVVLSVPTPRLLEVNFAPDLAVAAGFNPDLPGLLLREMLREEGEENGDGMFLDLF